MELAQGQTVQRQDMTSKRWSLPFVIETPEQLHYHQSLQSMNYQYREHDTIEYGEVL